jgi:hypothetical protein
LRAAPCRSGSPDLRKPPRDYPKASSGRTTSAISRAISSTVYRAVLRATLSAREGLAASTSSRVMSCQIGSRLWSPLTARVTSPSNSYWGQPFAKKALDRDDDPEAAVPESRVDLPSEAVADLEFQVVQPYFDTEAP